MREQDREKERHRCRCRLTHKHRHRKKNVHVRGQARTVVETDEHITALSINNQCPIFIFRLSGQFYDQLVVKPQLYVDI